MAKKNKLKISKLALKKLILELSVDDDGNKISDRMLWGSKEFMEKTGLYKVNDFTSEHEGCSLGTVSYYKKLLGVNAEKVFEHHMWITGKIDPLMLFEDWNLKSNVKSIESGVISEKTKKNNIIRDFGLTDKVYSTYTLRELENAIIELYNELGLDGKKELKNYYRGK